MLRYNVGSMHKEEKILRAWEGEQEGERREGEREVEREEGSERGVERRKGKRRKRRGGGKKKEEVPIILCKDEPSSTGLPFLQGPLPSGTTRLLSEEGPAASSRSSWSQHCGCPLQHCRLDFLLGP